MSPSTIVNGRQSAEAYPSMLPPLVTVKENVEVLSQLVTCVKRGAQVRVTL